MITLSSDFGTPYPAAMKGVILEETDARLVDVAHDFPRQDVRTAAFWLREVLPWFPPAIHLVVVDPGVGTARAALVVRAGEHALVGPDNGVLLPAARALTGKEGDLATFEIAVEDPASHTFHGRDVFAPAAAALHEAGVDHIERVGGISPVETVHDLAFPSPEIEESVASGEVLVVDGFGNAITNLPGSILEDRFGATIGVNGSTVPVRRSYAGVDPGDRLVTVGSHGYVEFATNRGRGDDAFRLAPGSPVTLSWAP